MINLSEPKWGPTGETVYERTYQRRKMNGAKETWRETVNRVVTGNLSLVYGPPESWSKSVRQERDDLIALMHDFKVLPAGRHLWASGVPGRQYLFNCHVAGWSSRFSDHFEFTFMRLMEGGGVGSNYGSTNLAQYGAVRRALTVHVVCDPAHPDYARMHAEGLLSADYSHEWTGAFAVEDSREGWAAALVDLLDTFMTDATVLHPNRVYDVSRVRAEGQPLRTFGGSASGPAPLARLLRNVAEILTRRFHAGWEPEMFADPVVIPGVEPGLVTPLDAMAIDHEIGKCVVAGGNRRSARMAIVPWDDPFVFAFIACKRNTGEHWTTNISVEVDQRFLDAVRDPLGYGSISERANDVLRAVVEGMLTNGEPGLWNSALSNQGEPNPVVCTNPCGEIALQEWENCNLGHVNMDAFAPKFKGGPVDWLGLLKAHRLMTRFLIRATYGDVNDPKQAAILAANRRIGVGHFGVQGFLVKRGIPFTRAAKDSTVANLLRECYEAVREEARAYAFKLRIPEPVKVTTVAPTGSIAKLAGRTEGIHPVYACHFVRRVRFSTVDPGQWAKVLDYAAKGYHTEADANAANTFIVEFPTEESLVSEARDMGLDPELVESADQIGLEEMLAFQALYQREYADNAVSFTVNFPEGKLRASEVTRALIKYLPALKGTTLMPDGTRPQAPYERITEAEFRMWAEHGVQTEVGDSVDEECSNGACPVR